MYHAASVQVPISGDNTANIDQLQTLVRVTFGTMTLCRALGASLGAFFGSPPGWYWYLKCSFCLASPFALDVCHGIVPSAILTGASDEEDVGLRPRRSNSACARGKRDARVDEIMAYRSGNRLNRRHLSLSQEGSGICELTSSRVYEVYTRIVLDPSLHLSEGLLGSWGYCRTRRLCRQLSKAVHQPCRPCDLLLMPCRWCCSASRDQNDGKHKLTGAWGAEVS